MYLFVYGTLQPGYPNYQHYCHGRIIQAQPALVRGKLFALTAGYPALTPGEDWVQGWLLEFPDTSLLPALDELEDFTAAGPPEHNLYQRQTIEVFDRQAQSIGQAWVYRMSQPQVLTLQGDYLPSGQWI